MSSLHKSLLNKGLPPPVPIAPIQTSSQRSTNPRRDYSVRPWTDYFEKTETVTVEEKKFCIYKCGNSGPLIVFLHGGGFSGLSWALLAKSLTSSVKCQCIALDFRGHGNTETENDGDLSADTLACDVCDVIEALDKDERVVLIGHSMGGAIAVRAAALNRLHTLAALIVIDVVEGTALESLPAMRGVLLNRPQMFRSAEKAVEWCVRSGYVRNVESARVTMIGQLKRIESSQRDAASRIELNSMSAISEEAEESNASECEESRDSSADRHHYEWRIDLSQTEKYWKGWFTGLSTLFLSVPVPKILMLAGVNNLDRELTIGQMQGKFQMQVLPKSGHAVHEDCPAKVAEAIRAFLTRHKLAELRADHG